MVEVLQKTADQVAGFSATQRVGAFLACTATSARLVAPFLIRKDPRDPWTWRDTGVRTLVAGTDPIDGMVARSFNGCTELGAIGDSIVDKWVMFRHELELTERSQLSRWQFALRTLRDALVTRQRLMANSGNPAEHVDVKANDFGKATTLIRATADLFSASPLGERMPRLAGTLQSVATIAIAGSGAYNVRQINQAKARRASRN